MKKINRILIAVFMLVGVIGASTITSKAEELIDESNKAFTEINVEILESDIVDPTKPVEPVDPEKPEEGKPGVTNPGEGEGSKPNENVGDAKLAIWRIPTQMNFSGKLNNFTDYRLELNKIDSGDEDGKDIYHRRLSVADVRDKEKGWSLKAKLNIDNLTHETEDVVKLNMKLSDSKKHKVTAVPGGVQVSAKEFEEEEITEKEIDNLGNNLQIGKDYTDITASELKGYTMLEFDNIFLTVNKGYGNAGQTYNGHVEWTLSDTAK